MTEPGDELLRIIDSRIRLLVGDPRGLVRHLRGTVATVDGTTCSVHLGGAAVPTPGVRWLSDLPDPVPGEEVLVAADLGGRHVILGRV